MQWTGEHSDAIWSEIDRKDAERAEQMPETFDALRIACSARERLRSLGWREGIYCPKDGSSFEVCMWGSTGTFTASYEGEWPSGMLWVEDGGDLWPSHPSEVMWRSPATTDTAER